MCLYIYIYIYKKVDLGGGRDTYPIIQMCCKLYSHMKISSEHQLTCLAYQSFSYKLGKELGGGNRVSKASWSHQISSDYSRGILPK